MADHHYLPIFHLEKWADSKGKLQRWSRIDHTGELFCKWRAPAAFAYEKDLYRVDHLGDDVAELVEREVFGKIDNAAAVALQKLITPPHGSQLTIDDRAWWAHYLNASTVRVPHQIHTLRERAPKSLLAELSKPNEDFDRLKGDRTEKTMAEYVMSVNPARILNAGMATVVNQMAAGRGPDAIFQLKWAVRSMPHTGKLLMISDNPLVRVGSLFEGDCLLLMPLTPRILFIAATSESILLRAFRMSAADIVEASNIAQFANAQRFAFGSGNREFIDRHLLRGLHWA